MSPSLYPAADFNATTFFRTFFGFLGACAGNEAICTACGTLVTWWALSYGWRLWRDARKVKQVRALDEATSRLDKRAVELEERERRLDEKLRQAVANEEQTEDL